MGRDKLYPNEYTPEIRANAEVLLKYVNDLIYQMGIDPEVSSGWRPKQINQKVKGAAKGSNHMKGLAVDLKDPGKKLAKLICGDGYTDTVLLEEFNLYAEHPKYTSADPKGSHWLHLQCTPPRSGRRIFIP